MKVFISGGSKNSKSLLAQQLAAQMRRPNTSLYYLATMVASDIEDEVRIFRHQQERLGWGFQTIEASRDILQVVKHCDPQGTFLLDSSTALLANEMFAANGDVHADASLKLGVDLVELSRQVSNIVFVSDDIYADTSRLDPISESYRRGLAHVDRQLAATCDIVLEVCFGSVIAYRGKAQLDALLAQSLVSESLVCA